MKSTIRVVAISDTHGEFPAIPPCDLLILSGDIERDFSHPGNPMNGYAQANWINREFRDWLKTVPAAEVVMTPGNHSFAWHRLRNQINDDDLRCHVLIDRGIELFGLKIWGTPWVGDCPGWAFNLAEAQLEQRWALIPDDTDILVLHDAPYEVDEWRGVDGARFEIHGSKTLLTAIDRVQPTLATFGHLHTAKGVWQRGKTTLVNVSVKDLQYRLAYPPYVTRLEVPNLVASPAEDTNGPKQTAPHGTGRPGKAA
jgi:Icc-related predicted phosphoesterase